MDADRIARFFRTKRQQLGVSQRQVNVQLGLRGHGVQDFELEYRIPPCVIDMIKVMAVFDISPLDLMTQDEVDCAEQDYEYLRAKGRG